MSVSTRAGNLDAGDAAAARQVRTGMRLARWYLLAAAFLATGCSGERAPLEPLTGTLEVRVLDAPRVTQRDGNGHVSLSVRLELRNGSRDLPLRWGGCGWLMLTTGDGAIVWSPPCPLILQPRDDRPVIAPGETLVVMESFYGVRISHIDPGTMLEREFRFTAFFGADRPESLERLLGRQPGQSESNVFTLSLND